MASEIGQVRSYRTGRERSSSRMPIHVETLEKRELPTTAVNPLPVVDLNMPQLTTADVQALLDRAMNASTSNDAIIAVVDRGGHVLGVRMEGGVDPSIQSDPVKKTFAVDGALALARTGAFFGNNQAPLTSRTVQFISQTTMPQRLVDSTPEAPDPNSGQAGPGFVAPIGIKNHFPPNVPFTPQVDLFGIEYTNRVQLPFTDANGRSIIDNQSYGQISGLDGKAQSRGIATLPGGIPIVKNGVVVGGIGVFFPGTTGYATAENSRLNDAAFRNLKQPDRSQGAELMAFTAVGGSRKAGYPLGPAPFGTAAGFTLPFGRIDLVGITLPLFGGQGLQGVRNLFAVTHTVRPGGTHLYSDLPVDTSGDTISSGQAIPDGWLVAPHAGGNLTAQDVTTIVQQGINEANQIRSAIRTPLDQTAKMVFAVSDKQGNILGLYRMPDATVFSIDVAVAKARNMAYYNDASQLQPQDKVPGVPAGTAFTNRTIRYLTLPRFPEGINGYPPGPFSIMNDPGIAKNGATITALPPASYTSLQGYEAFHPTANFHDPNNLANQNGIVFFPGSSGLYKDVGSGQKILVGGFGASGDGVDQDDDITYMAAQGYGPPASLLRADEVKVRGVRLPLFKFNRQPHEPSGKDSQVLAPPQIPAPQIKANGQPAAPALSSGQAGVLP